MMCLEPKAIWNRWNDLAALTRKRLLVKHGYLRSVDQDMPMLTEQQVYGILVREGYVTEVVTK